MKKFFCIFTFNIGLLYSSYGVATQNLPQGNYLGKFNETVNGQPSWETNGIIADVDQDGNLSFQIQLHKSGSYFIPDHAIYVQQVKYTNDILNNCSYLDAKVTFGNNLILNNCSFFDHTFYTEYSYDLTLDNAETIHLTGTFSLVYQ